MPVRTHRRACHIRSTSASVSGSIPARVSARSESKA
jgi:hypothetical protein